MGNISYLRLLQTILAQVDRDEGIVHLAEVMDDAYSFVKEAEPIKKIESHGRIILLMAQQTTECAYFIRDYTTNKGFCMFLRSSRGSSSSIPSLPGKRTLKNSFMSDVDSKIKQYEDKFKELKMAFQDGAILQTAITVSRIFDNLERLGERHHTYIA